ncbi:MAG: leucine-rich repeat domain-containing protein, partial [Muribaculaceae bacterium]|nr:leucine-rich repeat domain-containing protein [Muribaculaceae bacterium]
MAKYEIIDGVGIIPQGVTTIEEEAFMYCSSLTSIVIPVSVTEIGRRAFSHCENLKSIVVEEGNPKYDSRNNCNAIIETATNTLVFGCSTTIIPDSVTTIGDNAFRGCKILTSIVIPDSVTTIGDEAFFGCKNLVGIDIPDSVTWIGDEAFYGCKNLTSIVIPDSVTEIGGSVFSDCNNLKSIVVDKGNPRYDSRNNCNAIIETATNALV